MLVGVWIPPSTTYPLVPLILPFLAGLAPLIWYHLGYLRPRAVEGTLGPAEIDSVYYFGFLVTVGALGCTALRLATRGINDNFTEVAFQFGLGLLATGYAVWARVQLTAASKTLSDAEIVDLMKRVVQDTRDLSDNVQLGSDRFSAFANSVVQQQEEFASRIQGSVQKNIEASVSDFREAMKGIAAEGQAALKDLRTAVNDVTFGSEREALRNSVLGMTDTVTALNITLQELKTSASAGSDSVGAFASGLGKVSDSAMSAHEALSELGGKEGSVPKLATAMEESRSALADFNLSASVSAASFTSVSDQASAVSQPLKDIKVQAAAAARAMTTMAELAPKFGALVEQMGALDQHLSSMANSANTGGRAVQSMGAQADELRTVLINLNQALIDSTGGFKDSMLALSEEIEGRLTRNLASIEQKTSQVEELLLVNPETNS
ncbi:MAG: hypothetical protein CFE35_02775 [Novosphingobium sp. PASSN1]|nr:MAG: hypothetical protein CFE35_02775 [Novosphingobium sp. PASSN1]